MKKPKLSKTEQLNALMEDKLMALGAVKIIGKCYPECSFELNTKYGKLTLCGSMGFDINKKEIVLSYFSRFENPESAHKNFIDCNKYSGKWNFHTYAKDYTPEQFSDIIIGYIKNVI